jgi:hypothetical protein
LAFVVLIPGFVLCLVVVSVLARSNFSCFSAKLVTPEYEALLAGLRLAFKIKVEVLTTHVDSLLVSDQVNNVYVAKEETMKAYVKQEKQLKIGFKKCDILKISRTQNKRAGALR